ncbi:MAG: 16S rRNA (guanine(966)-N(2))-methyltransferase RsmD [Lachnospiraceae bacterium]
MRVIAGTARSLPLKTVEGLDTRPTTDRIKETLFNMLQGDIPGARFLDLFAGSGAIGIEALSRGASEAVFVENARAACACIRENLQFTKLMDRAAVMECDCLTALHRLKGKGVFDVIFMDPPYRHGHEKAVLEALVSNDIADEYTLIIFEASLDTDIDFVVDLGYDLVKVKEYKTNKHIFVKKKEA